MGCVIRGRQERKADRQDGNPMNSISPAVGYCDKHFPDFITEFQGQAQRVPHTFLLPPSSFLLASLNLGMQPTIKQVCGCACD